MSLRVKIAQPDPDDLAEAALNGATEIGRALASAAVEMVRNKIPSDGGWLTIYREALHAVESNDGRSWSVTGQTMRPVRYPAETTLLSFDAKTPASAVLQPYNPWPIDAVPAISGGWDSNVSAVAASIEEVSANRLRVHGLLPTIGRALLAVGAQVLPPAADLVINGAVYTDVVYLARRLELGLGGFPRAPHWAPTVAALESTGEAVANAAAPLVEAAMERGPGPPGMDVVSDGEMQQIDQARASAWGNTP